MMLAVVSSPATFCQASGGQTVTVPDNTLYRVFFQQATVWQNFAAKESAQGVSNGPASLHYQNAAGLTNAEDATLKSIAADCMTAVSAIESQRTQLTAPYPPGKGPLPAAVLQQLIALDAQKSAILSSHIQQLQSAFAPARFQLLDAYVRNTVKFTSSPIIPAK
jgi:hypothetical protein